MDNARALGLVALGLTAVAACSPAQQAPDVATLGDSGLDAVRNWASPAATALPSTSAATEVAPVSQMIGGLERRLEQEPDDRQGWTLLAQSYAFVDRMEAANVAIDRAVALGASRTELEARVFQTNREAR